MMRLLVFISMESLFEFLVFLDGSSVLYMATR